MDRDDSRELVLFIHGMWLDTSCWREWAQEFDRAGYQSLSFRWPGEQATAAAWRGNGRALPLGIRDLRREIAGLAGFARRLADRRPVVVGHGAGGLLAEILLAHGAARGAVSIAPLPAGLSAAASAVRLARGPRATAWIAVGRGSVTPAPAQFRRAFAAAVPRGEAAWLYESHATPGQPQPLLRSLLTIDRDGGWRGSDDARRSVGGLHRQVAASRGPLLLISAAQDRIVPEASVSALHRRYRRRHPGTVTDYQVFLDRGHSLTIDSGWRSVAYYCLDWLTRQGL